MDARTEAINILILSLKDIRAGLWCQGTLAQFGTCQRTSRWSGVLPDKLTEDNIFNLSKGATLAERKSLTDVKLGKKPMGCALGLVAMYSNCGHEETFKIGGRSVKLFVPEYPKLSGDSPETARDLALLALYDAIPAEYVDEESQGDEIVDDIYTYNDYPEIDQSKATEWFKRAIKHLKKGRV